MRNDAEAQHAAAMEKLRSALPRAGGTALPNLVAGEWVPGGPDTRETIDPTTGRSLADVTIAAPSTVDHAVATAREAGARWWNTDGQDRSRAMRKVADLIRDRADYLGLADTLDVGRPIRDTVTRDTERAARLFEYWAGATDRLRGATVPVQPGLFNVVLREPYGVVGAITPWNYPLTNAATKLAPALATGNAVVLKPAEDSPLSALLLGQCLLDAGLPAGLVSVLTGPGDVTGEAIVGHPAVEKITFTGSTEVGRKIGSRCGELLKSVSLELGGKSPMLVFPDADLDGAADAAVYTAFLNAGQTCTAGTRLLLHQSIADDMLGRMKERLAVLRIGDPLDEGTDIGPIVSQRQLATVRAYVASGLEQGAKPIDVALEVPEGGCFHPPVIFTDVEPTMRIAQEEIFGPVLSVFVFDDVGKAVDLANDTPYGLAASIWTSELALATELAAALQAGIVWTNCVHMLHPGSPYGGYKASGVGLEMGDEAIGQHMKTKSVWTATEDWRSPWASVRHEL
ncbi:aldehyde dehydrogenase family protein [Georgenia sp. AZ-5]|uniref:aldehyde dehydrogenase family protein n=1 Tax=Georgenia sp. AZ-5 TaxID=3367526 RepID=UPI003754FAFB